MRDIYIVSYFSLFAGKFEHVYAFPNKESAEEYIRKADLWRKTEAPGEGKYTWKLEHIQLWEKYPEL